LAGLEQYILTMSQIKEFTKEFRFLSNFYPCSVRFEGRLYKTVEHAWHASKTDDQASREFISRLPSPGKAKQYGKCLVPSEQWQKDKLALMELLVTQKFENPFLQPLLLATEDFELIETNTWHDNFWGDCQCQKCKNVLGENNLGKILMKVRSKIERTIP
jgi:ribA/ribD-fused uncharacterized protein